MGTSNSNRGTGPNTPLVPTWLTPGGTPPAPPPLIPPESDPIHLPDNLLPPPRTAGENSPRIPTPLENLPIPPNGNANRFRGPRSNFTKFISSGGGDRRSMGRALAGYVSKSSGGSRNATLGMGSSRSTTAILLNFFSSVQSQGAAPT
ncbi:MAG: hypothetical protein JWQ25_1470, partial [Daejeonella sp.]|nr:hypothetical protein [Daejeonella sp.]